MPRDPYKYFRVEARELLEQLHRGALELEKGVAAPGAVSQLLRLAHTLKGAAGVVRQQEIGERAHALEDALTVVHDASGAVSRDRIDLVLALIDGMSERVALLTAPVTAPSTTETALPDQLDQSVSTFRPDVDDLEALLSGVIQAHVQLGVLRPRLEQVRCARHAVDLAVDQLARARGPAAVDDSDDAAGDKARSMVGDLRGVFDDIERGLSYGIDAIDQELRQVQEAAERLRLAPASAVFTFLERAVREVARTLGKRVAFHAYGGDVRVDTSVLSVIQGALLQIVRNAVAHGIETGGEARIGSGKPAEGRITLRVTQRGTSVSFACTDDGRGIDLDAVQSLAQRKGLCLENDRRMEPDELIRMLLRGGMSTSGAVTDVSGRGIGLDVVREAAERLGGKATMRTDPGKGTTVELVVPVSIAALNTLMVDTLGVTAAIPLDAVLRTLRVTREDIVRTEHGESVFFDGRAIPLTSVRLASSSLTPARSSKQALAVVVRGRSGVAAVRVGQILGTARVIMRPLPQLAPATDMVAGAVLDAVGDPQLVLDPDSLVAEAHRAGTVEAEMTPPPISVLVVDDSLTTRMLEQSILESAGFAVDVAASGEEGLAKARAMQYALFLVDVEMPGMDGFTFIEQIRADPALRDIPSILVTSRNSAADRQRGQDVGAQAYMAKSEFDQGVLLGRIRTLVGR